MALIDTKATMLVCLAESDVLKMAEAIKGKPDYWIRVINTIDTACNDSSVTVLLQGPEGEEEELIEIR